MMDITDPRAREQRVVKREEPKIEFVSQTFADDGKSRPSDSVDRFPENVKKRCREEEESTMSKKRRKQLKPIKISTNSIEDMVKVPKQIIGLNNDFLGNVDDLSHTVPKEISSKSENDIPVSTDLRLTNPHPRSETSAGAKSNDSTGPIDVSRIIEKPEMAGLNVPNIETGPNYVANPHFVFPLTFRPAKTATFWSDANLKIFNQEAYCELCKKEFCNKYFLKTHKANKHGIYFESPATALTSATKTQTKLEIKETKENGRMAGDGEFATAFCDLCNKKFCNKYFVRRHKSKSHGLMEDDGGNGQGFASCHETESKIVQIASNNSTKKTDSTLIARDPMPISSRENDRDNQKKRDEEQEGPLNLIVNFKEIGESERDKIKAEKEEDEGEDVEDERENDGDDCSSENIEKLQTMLLRLNPSEAESKACRVCNEIPDSFGEHKCTADKREKEYLSEGNDSSSESKGEFGPSRLENNDYAPPNKFEHPKQTKPTSSYCEICNKELCNKYFMRTHMQRMHGIEIEHGTQIGGVVCNICNKELCSKYFLRVHKQNTHGIMSPNSLLGPSTSGNVSSQRTDQPKTFRGDSRFPSNFVQVCYICNKRFRSPKWLQAHFVSDHREEAIGRVESKESEEGETKEDDSSLKVPRNSSKFSRDPNESSDLPPEGIDVISKIFWENDAASKTYNCSRCSFTTSVLAFLFVHERSHFVMAQEQPEEVKPTAALQNLIHDKTFWQHQITQQIPECLDLSSSKPNYVVSLERNGS